MRLELVTACSSTKAWQIEHQRNYREAALDLVVVGKSEIESVWLLPREAPLATRFPKTEIATAFMYSTTLVG